jgi:hypothetical protein
MAWKRQVLVMDQVWRCLPLYQASRLPLNGVSSAEFKAHWNSVITGESVLQKEDARR